MARNPGHELGRPAKKRPPSDAGATGEARPERSRWKAWTIAFSAMAVSALLGVAYVVFIGPDNRPIAPAREERETVPAIVASGSTPSAPDARSVTDARVAPEGRSVPETGTAQESRSAPVAPPPGAARIPDAAAGPGDAGGLSPTQMMINRWLKEPVTFSICGTRAKATITDVGHYRFKAVQSRRTCRLDFGGTKGLPRQISRCTFDVPPEGALTCRMERSNLKCSGGFPPDHRCRFLIWRALEPDEIAERELELEKRRLALEKRREDLENRRRQRAKKRQDLAEKRRQDLAEKRLALAKKRASR